MNNLKLMQFVIEFYALEDIVIRLKKLIATSATFLRQREKLLEDCLMRHNNIIKHGSRTIFDYLCAASLGEARYSSEQCSITYSKIPHKHSKTRCQIYEEARHMNPNEFLPKLDILFNRGHWLRAHSRSSVGSRSWGSIVRHALQYQQMDIKIWLDTALSLSHNNGTAFSKPVLISLEDAGRYQWILNAKFEGKLAQYTDSLYIFNRLVRSYELDCLMSRAKNLSVVKDTEYMGIPFDKRWYTYSSGQYPAPSTRDLTFPKISWNTSETALTLGEQKPSKDMFAMCEGNGDSNFSRPIGCECWLCNPIQTKGEKGEWNSFRMNWERKEKRISQRISLTQKTERKSKSCLDSSKSPKKIKIKKTLEIPEKGLDLNLPVLDFLVEKATATKEINQCST